MRCRLRFLTLMLAIVWLGAPISASAQSETPFPLSFLPVPDGSRAEPNKSYFVYELRADSTVSGNVLLRNNGQAPMTVHLTAVDARTSQQGGSSFANIDETPMAVATWLKLGEQQVTLEPGQERDIAFTVHVPASINPGQYLAGISAYLPANDGDDTSSSKNVGAHIKLQHRYVIAVQINVPGLWTSSMLIKSIDLVSQPSGTRVIARLKNDGATFLKPKGSVKIISHDGRLLIDQPIEMGTFVTGTDASYPVIWPETPIPGKYQVSISLDYADGKTATYDEELEIAAKAAVPQSQQPASKSQQPAPGSTGAASQPDPVATVGAASQNMLVLFGGGLVLMMGLGGVMFVLGRRTARREP